MIVKLGMVEDKDIEPFIKQFEQLDADGSGVLDKDDLARGADLVARKRDETGMDLPAVEVNGVSLDGHAPAARAAPSREPMCKAATVAAGAPLAAVVQLVHPLQPGESGECVDAHAVGMRDGEEGSSGPSQ
eukprot:5917652-Prymnesium_polylepis.1